MPALTRESYVKFFWVAVLYFAQGFPAGIINKLLPNAYAEAGVSLEQIGLMSLVGLPWVLKFLWAPLVDRFGTRKRWMICCLVLLAVSMVVLSCTDHSGISAAVWALLIGMAFFSATQDISIDAYSIQLLEKHEMGPANGIRQAAYRVALIIAGGLLVGLSADMGWGNVEIVAAASFFVLAVAVFFLPATATTGASSDSDVMKNPWHPVKLLCSKSGAMAVIFFILIFKLGDATMDPMKIPFMVKMGLSPQERGLLVGTVCLIAAIAGALVGGVLTKRWGIFHALWILGLFQAFSNLGYSLAARVESKEVIWAAAIFEEFSGGLGSAAFLTFLMSICDKQFAATQYALLSAMYLLGKQGAGAISGYVTKLMGFEFYFAFTFLLAIPAFLLLPYVMRWTNEEGSRGTAEGV